jgi:cysteine-rich repeat protein
MSVHFPAPPDVRLLALVSCLLLPAALAACSDPNAPIELAADAMIDGAAAEAASLDERGPDLLPLPDAPFDTRRGETALPPDAVGFDLEACEPGSGCPLEPCASGKDCLSGYCVMHLGEQVCSQICVEECPLGFDCTQLAAAEPDVVFICTSRHPALCFPCTDDQQCRDLAGLGAACVAYDDEGFFCGSACAAGADCPAGYACEQVATVEGLLTAQCTLGQGVCPCSEHAILQGAATACFAENEHGRCEGARLCTDQGLTECDAPAPQAETCDGADNDCDGVADGALCDDGNSCTKDECAGEAGCSHLPTGGGECVDGDACTMGDHCAEGLCIGAPLACDDKNECTDDSCDPALGCQYEFTSAPCDDGDPCTLGDTCLAGACVGLPGQCDCMADTDCDDLLAGNPCIGKWYCDKTQQPYKCIKIPGSEVVCPLAAGSNQDCFTNACNALSGKCEAIHVNEGFACSDGDGCTLGETCKDGQCQDGMPLDCNDWNPCTEEVCEPAVGCIHVKLTGAPCSDGDPCTAGDACDKGACKSGAPVLCDDANPCTDETCDPKAGCKAVPNKAPCDDGNACTTADVCSSGWCVGGGIVACDDLNPCTTDTCEAKVGCVHQVNTAPCDDGNPCTTGDQCNLGGCVGGKKAACFDGNPCTDDACDPKNGCTFLPNAAACNDGNACTTGDHCAAAACVADSTLDCDDANPCTKDSCDPAAGCKHAPAAGPCSDGDICTTDDSCLNGKCQPGPALKCDDGNVCTQDACKTGLGCIFSPAAVECSDGNACTLGDHCVAGLCIPVSMPDCNDGNVCTDDSCDLALGCQHEPAGGPCDDGDACTNGDACAAGACQPGQPLGCLDADACTQDGCNPGSGCTHTPIVPCCGNKAVEGGEQCDDGNTVGGDGCAADCKNEAGKCSNGSSLDCNPPGTTLNPSSAFVDSNPPAGWTQCAGFVNTNGDDVANTFMNNCLNTSRLRVKAWKNGGQLEEDVYDQSINVGGSWPDWNYLGGGSMTKVVFTFWTGGTTFFTVQKGNDACSLNCCTAAPNNTMTFGTGSANSALIAPGNTDAYEWRVNCGGQALPDRKIAVYR